MTRRLFYRDLGKVPPTTWVSLAAFLFLGLLVFWGFSQDHSGVSRVFATGFAILTLLAAISVAGRALLRRAPIAALDTCGLIVPRRTFEAATSSDAITIPWSNIAGVEPVEPTTLRYLGIRLRDPDAVLRYYPSDARRVGYNRLAKGKPPIWIPPLNDTSIDEFAKLIDEYKAANGV